MYLPHSIFLKTAVQMEGQKGMMERMHMVIWGSTAENRKTIVKEKDDASMKEQNKQMKGDPQKRSTQTARTRQEAAARGTTGNAKQDRQTTRTRREAAARGTTGNAKQDRQTARTRQEETARDNVRRTDRMKGADTGRIHRKTPVDKDRIERQAPGSGRRAGRTPQAYEQKKETKRSNPVGGTHKANGTYGKTDGKMPACAGKTEAKVNNTCPYAEQCGACAYINLPYAKQLKKKQKAVEALMGQFCNVYPIVGMEQPLHYRHKVHAVFGCDAKGHPVYGIYRAGSHTILPVKDCLIEDAQSAAIIRTIGSLLRSFKIRTYNERNGYGLLRHVVIRKGYATGEIMVILVVNDPVFPSKKNFVKALRDRHPEITTVVLNLNDKDTTMVLGTRDIVLYGKGYIEDELDGLRFCISPQSFYQVNPPQAERLYRLAIEAAALTGKERVLDAYCGTGTIGIAASRKAGEVLGVELNRDAVRDAIQNARLNGRKNIRFYCADAGVFMEELSASGEQMDVVILDPPRSGSTEAFLSSMKKLSPKRIVYVSCNPETLKRDVEWMTENGYRAEGVWPVDMFGGTDHVEVVTSLIRM